MKISLYRSLAFFAIFSTLIVGNMTYFLGLPQAVWLPYFMGLFLYVVILKSVLPNRARTFGKRHSTGITPLVLAFIAIVGFSALLNLSSLIQTFVGGKNLVALWSVYLLVAFCVVPAEKIEKIILWVLPLSVIQVPFVLYQHFFVAATRSTEGGLSGVAWDAVVGTFGGDPMGGGASGVLAFIDAFALVLAIALWSRGRLTTKWLLLVLFSATISLALAEVKVIVVLIPLGMVVIGVSLAKERPALVTSMVVGAFVSMFGLLLWYGQIHSDGGLQVGSGSISDVLDGAFWYSLDSGLINFETREMGRMAAIDLWWSHGFMNDFIHGLFGYGPGASRSTSSFEVGVVAKNYMFNIDRSSAVQVLWEVGLIGFFVLCAILIRGVKHSFRLSKLYVSNPQRRAILESISAMSLMVLVMLPYSRDFLEVPAMGVVVMICLGFVNQISQSAKKV